MVSVTYKSLIAFHLTLDICKQVDLKMLNLVPRNLGLQKWLQANHGACNEMKMMIQKTVTELPNLKFKSDLHTT